MKTYILFFYILDIKLIFNDGEPKSSQNPEAGLLRSHPDLNNSPHSETGAQDWCLHLVPKTLWPGRHWQKPDFGSAGTYFLWLETNFATPQIMTANNRQASKQRWTNQNGWVVSKVYEQLWCQNYRGYNSTTIKLYYKLYNR